MEKIRKFYKGKNILPSEANSRIVELEKKYGEEISFNTLGEYQGEESLYEKLEYDSLVDILKEMSPSWKKSHETLVRLYKIRYFSRKTIIFLKEYIWVIVGTLLSVAILKYIFS